MRPELDLPKPFGYKTAWLALRTHDTERVASILRLTGARPANWREGIEQAYEGFVFVTPPLAAWTLAVGSPLLSLGEPAPTVKPLLEQMSSEFGEAQFFCTHRVVDLHVWARALRGRVVRGYGYIGERGETFWDEGEQTKEERDLGFRFFDERSQEVEDGDYWDRKDLTYPDEGSVMRLAGAWSLNPTMLDQMFKVPGWGLLGHF